MNAHRMRGEIDAIMRIEAAAHRINGFGFDEFSGAVLQSANAMPDHSAARARITRFGAVIKDRMQQVHKLAASGDPFNQVFGVPSPHDLEVATGPYTLGFALDSRSYEGLLAALNVGQWYFDTLGLCLAPSTLPSMKEEIGGSVILLRREEVEIRKLPPVAAVFSAARQKGYDLSTGDLAAMGMVNAVQNRGLAYKTFEAAKGEGVPSAHEIHSIAQRLATDSRYRNETERRLTELMGGLKIVSLDGCAGDTIRSPAVAVVRPATRKHEKGHVDQHLLRIAGYPQHDGVGSDLMYEQSAADREGDGHRHWLDHTGISADHDLEDGNIKGLARALYHGNPAAAQRFLDQRERVIDALAAAYGTPYADRDGIGWALNLMPFHAADRSLHTLAVAYRQR